MEACVMVPSLLSLQTLPPCCSTWCAGIHSHPPAPGLSPGLKHRLYLSCSKSPSWPAVKPTATLHAGCRIKPTLMQLTQSLIAISSKRKFFFVSGEDVGVRLGVNLKFKAPTRNKMMWPALSLFFSGFKTNSIYMEARPETRWWLMTCVQTSIYPGCVIQIALLKFQVTFSHGAKHPVNMRKA